MAIGARGQVLHDHDAGRLGQVAQAPFDERQGPVGQGLDDALVVRGGHQGDVAVKDRRGDGIGGDAQGDRSRRDRPQSLEERGRAGRAFDPDQAPGAGQPGSEALDTRTG